MAQRAIEVMYNVTSSPAARKQASDYLEQWRRQPDAWGVADEMLRAGAAKRDFKVNKLKFPLISIFPYSSELL